MNEEKPKWWSFFAWPIVGAAIAFGILALMTIGIFVLPIAFVCLLALLKWGGNRKSSAGLISGVGLPLIYIAYLNRDGPGDICTPYGQGGQHCTQEWSPWPWLIIGIGLVILGVVVFLRLRRKAAQTSELSHDEAVIATEPIPHPLDLPIENRARKLFASGAAIWTIVGLISVVKGLGNADQGAKIFFFSTALLAMLAGIGATVSALQGKRRATILLLFGSVIFPTYFVWELSLIPVAMACYLLFSPFVTSFRNPEMRQRNIQVLSILVIAIILGLGWLKFHVDPMASTESRRVKQGFDFISTAVSRKAGVVPFELTPVHAGSASYPDGTRASLWVPMASPLGIRSGCFYFEITTRGSASGGQSNTACEEPGTDISLERTGIGSGVVGFVGLWPARTVFVTADRVTSELPVTFGYFLIPGSQSADPTAKFTITLMSKDGVSIGKVIGLKASGHATPK